MCAFLYLFNTFVVNKFTTVNNKTTRIWEKRHRPPSLQGECENGVMLSTTTSYLVLKKTQPPDIGSWRSELPLVVLLRPSTLLSMLLCFRLHALYFHKFTYGPKLVRWTFLFICGISVTSLCNPSRSVEHFLRFCFWRSSSHIPREDGHVIRSSIIFLQWYTVVKAPSFHFISTSCKNRKITEGTVQFATKSLTTSSL